MNVQGSLPKDEDGNVAILFGLLAPVLFALAGAGIDYGRYVAMRAAYQEVADSAALAGAREYALSGTGAKRASDGSNRLSASAATNDNGAVPKSVAESVARKSIVDEDSSENAKVAVATDDYMKSVEVEISTSFTPTFLVGMFRSPMPVNVRSQAQASGQGKICVITLDTDNGGAVFVEGDGTLSGEDCSMYANSSKPDAIVVQNNGRIEAAFVCSSGGVSDAVGGIDPEPLTDCPPKQDPLATRGVDPPRGGGLLGGVVSVVTPTLDPGIYDGGLTIDDADVTLAPGVYAIKNGDLIISGASRVVGEGVSFHFFDKAGMSVGPDTTLELSAPTTGDRAGILMYQDPAANDLIEFRISSNDARKLVGTIYLKSGYFLVDSQSPVAGDSAYTALVVNRLRVTGAASLVLNSNYGDTAVPVPLGLNSPGEVSLRN
ncbi:MAG: hypothetical protein GC152_09055 [Alphaproteobacteria bacterium]|nr:hypothetical protein [Alphaproteobacteria bacterium]